MATILTDRAMPPAAASWAPRMLSILRIVTAFAFLLHGSAKILHVPFQQQYLDLAPYSLIWWAGMMELIGGFLLLLGLFTRPVAFLLAGEMAVAYFMAHAPRGLLPVVNQGDAAVLYCFVFLYFVFVGAGPWSLDAVWRKNRIV